MHPSTAAKLAAAPPPGLPSATAVPLAYGTVPAAVNATNAAQPPLLAAQPQTGIPQAVTSPAIAGESQVGAGTANPSGVILTSATSPISSTTTSSAAAADPTVPERLPPVEFAAYAASGSNNPSAMLTALRQTQADESSGPAEKADIESRSRFKLRMQIPDELPGANAPPIVLPPSDFDNPQPRRRVIDKLFPSPAMVTPIPRPAAGADAPHMTLAQLETMATANNPLLVQAAGDVMDARGKAIQAGVHPNPVVGYEADSVGSSFTRNYQGIYGSQTIKTAGKLGLARAAANMGFMNAEIELRQTRIKVLSEVRANYYAVLVAREGLTINTALERFTTEAYRIQVDKLKAGEGTGYEPAQLRTLVMQARAAVIQSQNRFISAWKQLAASIGIPSLPPAPLEGEADVPMPVLDYEVLLARILNNHPDAMQARNLAEQAKLTLQLAQVTPIPDVQLYGTFQRDFTVATFERTSYNMQLGVPLPVFDRNQGNIVSAQGRLRSAAEQIRVVRNDLSAQFADAYERYQSNRVLADYYSDQILPDLARAYRGVYERHQQESDQVGFGDIIVAQQNLAVGLATYVTTLGTQWIALTDIAQLLQLDDMRTLFQPMPPGPTPPAGQVQPDAPRK